MLMTSSTTSTSDNTQTDKPKSAWDERVSRVPPLTPEEVERRRLGAARFALLYSSDPLWKAKADADPDFWNKFYESQPNS